MACLLLVSPSRETLSTCPQQQELLGTLQDRLLRSKAAELLEALAAMRRCINQLFTNHPALGYCVLCCSVATSVVNLP